LLERHDPENEESTEDSWREGLETMRFRDKIVGCVDCGASFLVTIEEQRELVGKGLTPRRRYCQVCRPNTKAAQECDGRVKWFDDRKGYGFIEWNDGEDVFVHYSSIRGQGFRTLKEGEGVRFRVTEGEKGLQALDVMRLSEVSSAFSFYSVTRMAHP
jgi:CspA family cold shock protein